MSIFSAILASLFYGLFSCHYAKFQATPSQKTFWRNLLMGGLFLIISLIQGDSYDAWFSIHTLGIGLLAYLAFFSLAKSLDQGEIEISKTLYFLQYSVLWILGLWSTGLSWVSHFLAVLILLLPVVVNLKSVLESQPTNQKETRSTTLTAYVFGLLSAISGGLAIFWILSIVPSYGPIGANLASGIGASLWTLVFSFGEVTDLKPIKNKSNLVELLPITIFSLLGSYFLTQSSNLGLSTGSLALILSTSGYYGLVYGRVVYGKPATLSPRVKILAGIINLALVSLIFITFVS
jgi:hypothetical protein